MDMDKIKISLQSEFVLDNIYLTYLSKPHFWFYFLNTFLIYFVCLKWGLVAVIAFFFFLFYFYFFSFLFFPKSKNLSSKRTSALFSVTKWFGEVWVFNIWPFTATEDITHMHQMLLLEKAKYLSANLRAIYSKVLRQSS